ncbi:MAG: hypothetical protein K0V04_26895 [Deltaproteobacteria bacterium]|nr:hypothetical protein [Deltaproteobacteria bacterium]
MHNLGLMGIVASLALLGGCGSDAPTTDDTGATGTTTGGDRPTDTLVSSTSGEPETESNAVSSSSSSGSGSSSGTETGMETETDSDTDAVDSSSGEPPPSVCPDQPDDLSVVWRIDDLSRNRGEAVSVAEGVVVWSASGFPTDSRVRAHDLDGVELWFSDISASPGEGSLRRQDVVAGSPAVFGGTSLFGPSAMIRAFDQAGQIVFQDNAVAGLFDAGGVAIGSDGTILLAGSDEDLQLRTYLDDGSEIDASFYDHGASEFVSNAVSDPDGGYLLSAHTNGGQGPLAVRLDDNGAVEWVGVGQPVGLETASGIAPDGVGGAWLAIAGEGVGRLAHFDANGGPLPSIPSSFPLQQVVVDGDGRLGLVGRRFQDEVIVVERRTSDGDLLAETTIPGNWGLDLATDDACDLYVVGSDDNGAFLAKLD